MSPSSIKNYSDKFKKPGVDDFLAKMAEMFEFVLFTASTQRGEIMLMESLFFPHHWFPFLHLFSREACLPFCKWIYITALSLLGTHH